MRRGIVIRGAAILALGIAAGAGMAFYFRPPVLVVTDEVFEGMYGGFRSRVKQAVHTLRLFRRVQAVRIADASGAEVVVFAIESASSKPFCVLFPYRYLAGARLYREEYPGIPAVVLGGRNRANPGADGLSFTGADTETDYYRAGRCAAIFAGETEGELLFFQDESLSAGERESFTRGLREGNYAGRPRYLNGAGDLALPGQIACAVVVGTVGEQFWKLEAEIPVILFSWLDPAFTSRKVKVIFDDSPWALAARIVPALSRGGAPAVLASEPLVVERRVADTVLRERLLEALRAPVSGTPETGEAARSSD